MGMGMSYISGVAIRTIIAVAVGLISVTAAQAVPIVMDFEGLSVIQPGTGATTSGANYLEDGMTMSPSTGGHYDVFNNVGPAPATSGVMDVTIHQGNNGAGVSFTFASGNFDALSLDIIGWSDTNDTASDNTVTFSSSAGGSHSIDNSFTGTIDFSSILNFSNISSFSISAPNPSIVCGPSVRCPQMTFDTFVFDDRTVAPVPLPTTWPLLVGALGLIGAVGRRKRPGVIAEG
jgi:hypothetical protein